MGRLKKVWTYFAIALVALVASVNYELFVFPNQFAPSGLNGICTMIQHVFGISVGYLSLLINVPLAIWCYIEVSKPVALRSMVYVGVFSVGLLILEHVDLSGFAYITENGTSKILGPLVAGIIQGYAYSILAKVVIIATGGFGANLEMVTRYCPNLRGMATLNHQGATGDAFTWIKAVGGYLIDLDKIQIHPTSEYVNHILITEAVRGNGAILVNSDGQRFVNEMQTRDSVSAAILSQRGGMAYLLFDQQVRQSLASIETYQNQGVLISTATIAELADKMGINRQTLTSTMSRYTEMQLNGKDDDFGRAASAMTAPLNVPPFYAVGVTPAIHHTMGGIKVDPDMHVLREDGTVLPGLYAAGEVTGGLHGANRLGGNGVGDVVVNGKIAGRNAAKEILGL